MIIGFLKAAEGKDYITWKEGKAQIRALLKAANIQATGTFRPRSVNRSQYSLPAGDSFIVAQRKPGAEIRIEKIITESAADLDADTLTQIQQQAPGDVEM